MVVKDDWEGEIGWLLAFNERRSRMIEALRFVDRDGKKRLQQATQSRLEDGDIVYDWEDVPYVTGEEEKAG